MAGIPIEDGQDTLARQRVRALEAAELSTADRLTTIIALLAAVASATGLLFPPLYRDNAFVLSAWKGSDLVTLFVSVPALVAAARFAQRGSVRALLVWFGLLDYILYDYAFYVFGATFNALFLIYVALFTLSGLALIFGLTRIDIDAVRRRFSVDTPVKWISGYMVLVATGLSAVYLLQIMTFVVTGQLPPIVVMTGHPTSVVFAIDLSLLVPGLVVGAYWLWTRQSWGYVLAGILNVKGTVYTLALTVASMWAAWTGASDASAEAPIWLVLTGGNLAATALLFSGVRPLSIDDEFPPRYAR
jgi:hypothetical protein